MKKWIGFFTVYFIPAGALAAEAAAASGGEEGKGLYALAAALAITVGAVGGAIGQGMIGASAMEGLARNPQAQKNMFTSMILGLAFIESIMIYALVISIMILAKM